MAKSKTNRITATQINKVLKDVNKVTTIQWNAMDLEIKNSLTLDEMIVMSQTVVDGVFDDKGDYKPELLDFMFKALSVAMYTNINIPNDDRRVYDLVYATDIIDVIECNVNFEQYTSLLNAIKSKAFYLSKLNIKKFENEFHELLQDIESSVEKMESAFDDVSDEDVKKAMENISSFNFNEENIVNAILKDKDE